MSDPVDTTKVRKYGAIQSALCELVSAESSCNMYPDPIPREDAGDPDVDSRSVGGVVAYISETDANVKHALEHVHAAFRLMNMAHHDQESLKTQVYKLVCQLREAGIAPKIKTWLDLCSRCETVELADPATEVFCATCTAEISSTTEEEEEP